MDKPIDRHVLPFRFRGTVTRTWGAYSKGEIIYTPLDIARGPFFEAFEKGVLDPVEQWSTIQDKHKEDIYVGHTVRISFHPDEDVTINCGVVGLHNGGFVVNLGVDGLYPLHLHEGRELEIIEEASDG